MNQHSTQAETLYARVRLAAEAHALSQTLRILPLVRQWHAGQYRKGSAALPYVTHPLTLACHALSLGLVQDELLAALLLHDVAEDCGVAIRDLPVSPRVQHTVALVTFRQHDSESYAQAKARYYAAIREDDLACLVKVLDRCHNVSCMADGFTRTRMAEYVEETETYILPLLDVLDERCPHAALWALRYHLKSLLDTYRHLL